MIAVDTLPANQQAVLLNLLRREQVKMSFHVPLVGPDGLVVVNDTKVLEPVIGAGADPVPEYQFGSDSKFLLNLSRGIVCAVAGTFEAITIAKNIVGEAEPPSPLTGLESHQAWRRKLEQIADKTVMPEQGGAEITILRVDSPRLCWKLSKFPGHGANCTPVHDRTHMGNRSSARFLPQHLWKHQKVQDLKKLGLLTLAFAERENSLISGDFEVLSLTDAGFKLERFKNADVKQWAATFLENLQSLFDTHEMNLTSTEVPL